MRRFPVVIAAVALALSGCGIIGPDPDSVEGGGAGAAPAAAAPPTVAEGIPGLRVTELATGLANPWDVGVLPDGRALVPERDGQLTLLSSITEGATASPVTADFSDLPAEGEGGLMGLVVHPDFDSTRRFTTCQTYSEGVTATDVRLVTWELAPDGTSAARVVDPLLGGLPVNASGRHSGCRTTLGPDGALLVGTGDTGRGAIPQDVTSLGGKTLRIDLQTGAPLPDNPFADALEPNQRLIYTYGHRNVQGVAVQPDTGAVYSAEHGPDTDDEVNLLQPGGNYGWDPSQGGTVGGYDENVPMTDLERFPDAVPAAWSSGSPVEAISGAAFATGLQWGELDGALAVGALRGQALLFMTLDDAGAVASVVAAPELDETYGRIRSVRTAPDGALLVTTDNNVDDRVLRVEPL